MTSVMEDLEEIDWKEWEAKGKYLIVKNARRLLENRSFAVIDETGQKNSIPRLIYTMFYQCLYGSLSPDNIVEACIALSELDDEIPSVIMDVITIFDTEMDSQKFITNERTKLLRVLVLLDEKWCPELGKERMEFETQNEYNRSIKVFHSKFIKLKTRLYYKQNKFNLYREENEGYAKLIMQLSGINLPDIDTSTTLKNIKSLIGCFSLDPTRVIDIILDNFQLNPFQADFFIPLLKMYMPDTNLLSEVVGFRYVTFIENGVTPRSLHIIVTIMLHYGLLSIDDVYPWLSPEEEEIKKEVEQIDTDEKSLKKSIPQPLSKEEFEKNQKLSLCEVMVSLGSWRTFQMMLTRIPHSYIFEKDQIAEAVCKFIHYLIAPVYATHSGLSDKLELAPIEFKPTVISEKQPKTFVEVTNVVFPILYTLGASLRHDLVLVFKLTRMTSTALQHILKTQDTENIVFEQITTLIQECLLPTLSNIQANCCVSEAIWNVVKLYPLQARYSLYYYWREYLQTNQVLLSKRCQGKVNAKSCMKRVSKENVKQIGRLLGKLSHYSPVTLFDYILFQIQMHDNLIGPVVDSLKYMTNMSYDVLGFCIFNSLYNDTKQRQKHDGTTVLSWFQSTALFCATVFKKYNIDLSGILLYIMEQLKNNRSIELLILKEILQKMTGIDITDDMTQHQIDSLSGGELLRSEAGYFVQQQNFKKTATRLKDALVENNLVAPLGIMLAQQRNYIFYSESKNSHLKFIGKLYDECHDTLLQYGAFISGPIMHDTHSSFPTIRDLLLLYKLDLDAAFYLSRPVLKSLAIERSSVTKKDSKKIIAITTTDAFFEIVDAISPCIEELYLSKQWEDISPKFVALFWSLGLSDISVPVSAYQKEIAKQKDQDQGQVKTNKIDNKMNTLGDKLSQELKDQQQYAKSILEHLKARKNDWFLSRSIKPAKNEMITQFLQMCIFPRCILSITDALFCAHFIHTLHTIRTGNFSTLLCYDRLLCDITFSVMSCTENEASRYGRFLCAILQNIMRWHSSKEIYDKECANTPGFVTKFRASNEFSDANENVHFENYRHVCHKWHYKITRAVLNLLESGEYVQIRNGLIVLIKLLPTFPIIGKLAQFIEKRINKVKEEEKNNRQDLYTLALSYSGLLMSKSQQLMSESDFHVVSSSTSTQSSTNETSNSLREDKLDIDTESFNTELPTDIYLSPPSYSQSHPASPPSTPPQQNFNKATSPTSSKETSPTREKPDKQDGNSSHDKSDRTPTVIYRDIINNSRNSPPKDRNERSERDLESHEYFSSRDEDSRYEVYEDNQPYDVENEKLEEGELNRRMKTVRRTRRKSRVDDKERRKVAKPRIRSRSGR